MPSMSIMTRDQLLALIDKVATMREGHDSIGPTGLVCHFTPEEQAELLKRLKAR
jgi:hypothetical protein